MRCLDVAVYRGKRDQNTCSVTVDGKPLDRRLDVSSLFCPTSNIPRIRLKPRFSHKNSNFNGDFLRF